MQTASIRSNFDFHTICWLYTALNQMLLIFWWLHAYEMPDISIFVPTIIPLQLSYTKIKFHYLFSTVCPSIPKRKFSVLNVILIFKILWISVCITHNEGGEDDGFWSEKINVLWIFCRKSEKMNLWHMVLRTKHNRI